MSRSPEANMVEPANLDLVPAHRLPTLASWPPAPDDDAEQTRADHNGSPEPEFISIPEWARRLGISPESGYKAARLGQIRGCFNIGRLYRVNWPVFVEATASMRSGTGETP
jgi:hypothetical protein